MENDFKLSDDKPMWLTHDLSELLQEVYDHYRSVVYRNTYLQEENERLKSEQYKDEELSKMKEMYDKMSKDYYRGFPITEEEAERINDWMNNLMKGEPEMKINSARFYYKFYPTPIGVSGTVIDSLTGEKFEFQKLN